MTSLRPGQDGQARFQDAPPGPAEGHATTAPDEQLDAEVLALAQPED